MTADDTREALHLDFCSGGEFCTLDDCMCRCHIAAARRDPEPVASADAASFRVLGHPLPDVIEWKAFYDAGGAAHGVAIRGTEAGLDVERLARALRYIHGDSVPFPTGRTPEEYAAFIAECDARLASADSEPS